LYGEHPQTLDAMVALAEALDDLQDHAAALALFSEVVVVGRRLVGVEPDDNEVPLANCLCRLACTHVGMGNHQLALPLIQEAVEVLSRLLDADDSQVLIARGDLAYCHAQMGDHPLALPMYVDVLERERRVLGNEHPNTLTDVGNCAETLCLLGDHAAAAPLFREVVAGMAASRGDEDIYVRYWRRWLDCNARRERGPNYEAFKAEQETMYERRAKRPRMGHTESRV
jgi:tetratricopeptide (TPR) repeat protein